VITTQKVEAGTAGTVVVEFPNLQVRTGEYPVYYRISDLGGAHTNYDVVDSLTVPLIIRDDEASAGGEVDAYRTRSYFPLSSATVSGTTLTFIQINFKLIKIGAESLSTFNRHLFSSGFGTDS